ncbi:MAG: DUF1905 domain-containing protein [Saprospiraceae bacterium]|nr:DUF1905 domain-containing protein [Saprospiraceae bacterium]
MDAYAFTATLEKFNSNLWGFHIAVPDAISQVFVARNAKRVVCTLNEQVEFQCALMPRGDGSYFININKKLRDQLRLKLGSPVHVGLLEDASEYGLPMPEEFSEVLKQDTEGDALFHALTPGKQRTLLYIAGSVKSPDLRIERALIVLDHLRKNDGKIDFKMLNADLKKGR